MILRYYDFKTLIFCNVEMIIKLQSNIENQSLKVAQQRLLKS